MTLEIRTYRLHEGRAEEFVEVMRTQALPLLAQFGITVLACGLSLDRDEEAQPDAYLIRAFDSREQRARAESEFYGSEAWQSGPRAAVLSPIVSFHTVVLDVSPEEARALVATLG